VKDQLRRGHPEDLVQFLTASVMGMKARPPRKAKQFVFLGEGLTMRWTSWACGQEMLSHMGSDEARRSGD